MDATSTLNDNFAGPDSSRSLSSSMSNINNNFPMGASTRRTSTISSSCSVLPRVESDCELTEPQTSLVGLLRDASERDDLGSSQNSFRGRRKSMVSSEELAKVNLKNSSRAENMAPVVGVMRDSSTRSASDMDSSLYEVALPKKSPLHRQVQTRRQTINQQTRSPSTATTASHTSVTSAASPMRRRSVVDPSKTAILASSLPKEAVVGPSSSAMRDVSEMDSSQLDTSLPRRRRRSVVSPEDLAKVNLTRTNTPDHVTPVVGPMRDTSDMDSSQIQIALPKKSPLLRQIQTRQSMVAAELKKATVNRRASSAVIQVARVNSGSQSPVRNRQTGRRKSMVSPEELAKVNLKSSSTAENITPVVGLMRDNSERDSSKIQIALPKKSPLHRHMQTRQSMVAAAAEPKINNTSPTTASSPASRRRSTISPESLAKSLSGEGQQEDSNHTSMRRSVLMTAQDLAKAGIGSEASQHSIMSDSGHVSMQDISAPVVEPMRDSSMRDTSMRDSSEREIAANFEVPMPKKSPLHARRTSTQSNGSSTSNNSQARSRSVVTQEDIVRVGLMLRNSSKNSLGSLGEDSGHYTHATIEEGDEDEETEEVPKAKTAKPIGRSATDSSALAGLRRTMAEHAANKYGIPLSHPSLQKSYTPPPGSSRSVGSAASSASLGSASVASVEDPDRASKKRLSFLRNSSTEAPSTSNSSNVDNDARIKVGLRNFRRSISAAATPTQSVASTNSVDNDARIKAGLRSSRMSMSISETGTRTRMSFTENTPAPFMAAMARASGAGSDATARRGLRRTSMPALVVGAGAGTSGAATRRGSDLSAQDARVKAGLRHSGSAVPGAHASSDLSSSDARTKAGLRNSTISTSSCTRAEDDASRTPSKCGLRTTQFGRSPPSMASMSSAISCASALSDATGCGGSISTRGLRRNRPGDADTDSKGSFANMRVSVGVPSADSSVVDETQPRPGAYRASTIQVEQQEFPVSIERVDSLRGDFLGREGNGEEPVDETNRDETVFSDEHANRDESIHLQARSDHFSMVSSLGDLDAQSTRTIPFGDATVEPIQESPKEDEDFKGSQRKLLLCAIVAGILVLGMVGAVVGVVAGGSSSSSTSPPAVQGEEGTDGVTLTLDEVFGDLITDLPADTIVSIQYGQASDPQVKAFKWLAADPNLADYSIPQRKQRMALASFYYATNGNRWFPEDVTNPWLSYDSHECDWFSLAELQHRTACNTTLESPLPPFEHFEYISLDLTGRELVTQGSGLPNPRLSGGLIPELAMLSSLRRLDLSWNKLRGSIPISMEPWLSSLEEIVLFDNDLTGNIPASLYWNAHQLWLGMNDFEQSAIPPSIGSALTSLSLTNGNIVGTIPPQLFNPNLQELFLAENSIEGSIPTEIGTASLVVLQLHQNQLSSSLPTEIGLLANCSVMRVFGNRLTGTLPSQLGRLSALHQLMVSSDNFANKDLSGTIPQEFFVASNETGEGKVLPAFPNMMHLMLEDTRLSGSMPTQIGLMTNMVVLRMGWNEMLGSMPSEVGLMTSLETLSLQKSTLTSSIPSELGLLSKLGYLDLAGNELTGDFPNELAPLGDKLEKVFLDGNVGLGGTIPDTFCSIPKQFLDFTCDTLCGCSCPCDNP